MELESFEKHQFQHSIQDLFFLKDRTLLGFQFETQFQIYRIFEPVVTLPTQNRVLFTQEHFVAYSVDGKFDWYSLETGQLTMSNSIGLSENESITDCRFFDMQSTLLLVVQTSTNRILITNLYFKLMEITIPGLLRVELIPKSFLLAGITESGIKVIDCSSIESGIDFLKYISHSRQELQEELKKVETNVGKLKSEVKAIKQCFSQLEKRLEIAFEEHQEPPRPIHWKRLVAVGDYDHDMIQTLHSYQKQFKQIEKQFSSSRLKFKQLFVQLTDSIENITHAFISLSNSNRLLHKQTQSIRFIDSWNQLLISMYLETNKTLEGKLKFVEFIIHACQCYGKEEKEAMEVCDTKDWFGEQTLPLDQYMDQLETDTQHLVSTCNSAFEGQSLVQCNIKSEWMIMGEFCTSFHHQELYVVLQDGPILLFVKLDPNGATYCCVYPMVEGLKSIGYADKQILFVYGKGTTDAIGRFSLEELAFGETIAQPKMLDIQEIQEFDAPVSAILVNQHKRLLCALYENRKTIELFDIELAQ
jgi:hypothetical protein